jgi:hypothetical protein
MFYHIPVQKRMLGGLFLEKMSYSSLREIVIDIMKMALFKAMTYPCIVRCIEFIVIQDLEIFKRSVIPMPAENNRLMHCVSQKEIP